MKAAHKITASAACIAVACSFIRPWEGLSTIAQVDKIGTGHPVTYCYGMTHEHGRVKVGQKFTPQQCSDLLAKTLPSYWDKIEPCLKRDVPDKAKAALISAAYNAGPEAVCKSPMIAAFSRGDLKAGCEAFSGWYVRASGRVVKGLINRRDGERDLCLEGLISHETPSLFERIKLWLLSIFSSLLPGSLLHGMAKTLF